MKKLLLFTLIITNFSSFSQTINEIVFEKKSHDNLKLNKIELLSDKTILYFTLTSSSKNEWFNINQKSFLNDHTNKISYDLLKAENVEYSPKKTYFSKETKTPVPLFCLPLRNQVNHFSSQSNAVLFL